MFADHLDRTEARNFFCRAIERNDLMLQINRHQTAADAVNHAFAEGANVMQLAICQCQIGIRARELLIELTAQKSHREKGKNVKTQRGLMHHYFIGHLLIHSIDQA